MNKHIEWIKQDWYFFFHRVKWWAKPIYLIGFLITILLELIAIAFIWFVEVSQKKDKQ